MTVKTALLSNLAGTKTVTVDAIVASGLDAVSKSNASTQPMAGNLDFPVNKGLQFDSKEVLDDYDEQEVVVSMAPNGSGTVTLASTHDTMSSTKIGNIAIVTGRLDVTAVSAPVGVYVTIGTLPHAPVNAPEAGGSTAVSVTYYDGANWNVIPGFINETQTSFSVYLDASTIVAGDSFYINLSYRAV